jgi:hypothetical protein
MAIQITERQHFVPRAYLKYFSDKKGSGHYNIMALPVVDLKPEAIIERNTKSICYEKNLYTLPGSTNEEKMLLETFYSEELENKYEVVYSMLIDPSKSELSNAERELIVSTVATMFYRVPIWQKKHTDVMRRVFSMCIQACNHTGKKDIQIEGDLYVVEGKTVDHLIAEYITNNKSHQVITQLQIALKLVSVRLRSDNVYIFKLEEGEQEFITSDNPVKLQNLHNQRIMPFDPSNIMKLPLDHKHYLMLMPNNDNSNLNRIVRHNAKGGFSRREELISNTEQLQGADQYVLGSTCSLTRFLNTKDTDIPLADEEQELLDRLIALGSSFGWFNLPQ